MAQHLIIVICKSRNYECYFDEALRLSVVSEGKVVAETRLKSVFSLDDVKTVAMTLIRNQMAALKKNPTASAGRWTGAAAFLNYFLG